MNFPEFIELNYHQEKSIKILQKIQQDYLSPNMKKDLTIPIIVSFQQKCYIPQDHFKIIFTGITDEFIPLF